MISPYIYQGVRCHIWTFYIFPSSPPFPRSRRGLRRRSFQHLPFPADVLQLYNNHCREMRLAIPMSLGGHFLATKMAQPFFSGQQHHIGYQLRAPLQFNCLSASEQTIQFKPLRFHQIIWIYLRNQTYRYLSVKFKHICRSWAALACSSSNCTVVLIGFMNCSARPHTCWSSEPYWFLIRGF